MQDEKEAQLIYPVFIVCQLLFQPQEYGVTTKRVLAVTAFAF